ncbi:unnamed protein product [Mesocestoides corti]|uniref:BZIP domain-containing protein n=1 Tax=Mesocestoides corti TaxID=53468 RepID=A0A0R3U547_MESCO|nr:unnamed protein product [Mesocestoides corti]
MAAREAVIFATKVTLHLVQSIVHLYCAKITYVCSLPLKQMAIASAHNYQVRVLLHELYPDQGSVLGAEAFRRGDLIFVDEFLLPPPKNGSDDAGDGQVDEINFLFQTNHLPISVFQPNPQNHNREVQSDVCQASCSTAVDSDNDVPDSKPHSIVPDEPEQDDLIPLPEDVCTSQEFVFTSEPSENSLDLTPPLLILPDEVPKPCEYSSGSSTCSYQSASPVNSDEPLEEILKSDDNSPAYTYPQPPHPAPRRIKYNTSSESLYSRESRHATTPKTRATFHKSQSPPPSSRVPVFVGPLTGPTTSAKPPRPPRANGVLKSLSNFGKTSPSRHHSPRPATTFVWPRYDKPHFSYSQTACDSDSSFDSSDDLGHSSDSDVPRRQPVEWEDRAAFEVSDFNSAYADSSVAVKSRGDSDGAPRRPLADRLIRDVNVLEALEVPFSYEEVAYSSNEHFREIKSTPGLTIDQVDFFLFLQSHIITAMLDARRRATNRQAAERCRRVKSAARNSLASQLDRLRLEHADLSRRILRTRKRRQQKWDELTSTQQYLLQNLVDSAGNPLDPSQWRIQTTGQGEMIVVRVDNREKASKSTTA